MASNRRPTSISSTGALVRVERLTEGQRLPSGFWLAPGHVRSPFCGTMCRCSISHFLRCGALVLWAVMMLVLPVAAAPRAVPSDRQTALDRYVAKPDASYAWTMAVSVRDDSATGFAIDLTSQTWRTTNDVSRPM